MRKFDYITILNQQKQKDIKDLQLLLDSTYVPKTQTRLVKEELLKICHQKNINLNIEENKLFDATKPEIT